MRKPLVPRIIPVFFFILLLSLGYGGCGKKGPPVAPESTFPAAVFDLRAWPREGAIFLGWTLPTKNADGSKLEDLLGFRVMRREAPLVPSSCPECPLSFRVVAEIDVDYPRGALVERGRVLWADPAVRPQHGYTYFVLAYNSYRSPSHESNRVKIAWDIPPASPTEIRVKSDDRALEVTWNFSGRLLNGKEMAEPPGFNLYRRGEGERFGLFPLTPEPVPGSRFVDSGLENGKRYFYEVRSVRNFQGTLIEGPASITAEGIPEKKTPPSPPTGLVAVFEKEGVALRWNQNPEPDIAGYEIYRREAGEESLQKVNVQLVKESYFLDSSAVPQKSYFYRLKAVDTSRKESEFSREVEISLEPNFPKR